MIWNISWTLAILLYLRKFFVFQRVRATVAQIKNAPPDKVLAAPTQNLFPVEMLVSTGPLLALQQHVKLRQRIQRRALRKWEIELKLFSNANNSYETRGSDVRRLVTSVQKHPAVATYHQEFYPSQCTFDALILDQRTIEGKNIQELVTAISETGSNEIPPYEVVDFLQEFVDQCAIRFNVPDDCLDILRLFMNRAVYPKLFPILFSGYQTEVQRSRDAVFQSQIGWLRQLPPEELDPSLKPFNLDMVAAPISQLEEIVYHLVGSIALDFGVILILTNCSRLRTC